MNSRVLKSRIMKELAKRRGIIINTPKLIVVPYGEDVPAHREEDLVIIGTREETIGEEA